MTSLRAYNAGSERVLSPRLQVVDAASEPVKVLRVLMEGLGPHERNGIWLINFNGAPVKLAATGFDLIHLDDEYRVLQAAEILPGQAFEPFRGRSAGALILPPKTIARSRTFTGDRIRLDGADDRTMSAAPASAPKRAPEQRVPEPRVPEPRAQATTTPSPNNLSAPSELGKTTRSSATAGRPTRSGSLSRREPTLLNLGQPQAADSSRETPDNTHTAAPPPDVKQPKRTRTTAQRAASDSSFGAVRTIAPIPSNLVPYPPEAPSSPAPEILPAAKRLIAPAPLVAAPVALQAPARIEQPLITHSFPAARIESPAPAAQPPVQRRARDEDEMYIPTSANGAEQPRLPKRVLSWFLSDERAGRRKRRASRISVPGLVGYYFAGGAPIPHEIRNISVLGFYMVTDQRWMPGTIIRVTLQSAESNGDDDPDTITVFSRVLNWGPDGGGFEFVFDGLEGIANQPAS